MKIITIPDIHGCTDWKKIIELEKDQDLTIFLGDYVDHWTYSNDQIYDNLKDIMGFKYDNPNKVVLLYGNHDLQYLFAYNSHGCSGYRPEMYFDLHELFNKNINLFQAAYQYKNYIWTHAGISNGWMKTFNKEISADSFIEEFNTGGIHSKIYDVGKRRGGWNKFGGIFWADMSETCTSYIKGFHQIVGHTKVKRIEKFGDENGSIVFTDTMENKDLNIRDKYRALEI